MDSVPARVLVVEDDPAVQAAVVALLAPAGYEVTTADDGRAALRILVCSEQKPDLMILDLGMPKVDGATVLAAVRAVRGLERLPVLVLTGEAMIPDYVHRDASSVLEKPFDGPRLLQATSQLLR
jgi:CheY-like chemotaxis protein